MNGEIKKGRFTTVPNWNVIDFSKYNDIVYNDIVNNDIEDILFYKVK